MSSETGIVRQITSEEQLKSLLSCPRVVLHCHAPWAAPCVQVKNLLETLSSRPPSTSAHDTAVTYGALEPERLPMVLKQYDIVNVPTVLFFSAERVVRRIEGADTAAIASSAKWLSSSAEDLLLRAAIELSVSREVVLVMKGEPGTPKCPFCKEAVTLLRSAGVMFDYVDISGDVNMRDMIKKMSEWNTFPMLFANGRLVGGVDRIRELVDAGRLVEELSVGGVGEVSKKETGLEGRLKGLVEKDDVVLFMKGNPDGPRCGFSRRIVDVLRGQDITFGHFDILQDEEVRQGMKKFSDWPTFPQLYSKGNFVGGLDVVKELVEAGELKKEMGIEK